MAFDWRKLFGLRSTQAVDQESVDQEPLNVQRRTYSRGDTIGGEYRVLDVFSGGMGHVYLVNHDNSEVPIVLKTLQRPEDERQRALFIREAETWVSLGRHRNVVSAAYVREVDGQLFVAAEYVPPSPGRGNTMEAYVGIDGLPVALMALWVGGFCDGMNHSRNRGVVAHRDIKPANLMIDPDGTLRITDFGLARSFSLPSGAMEGLAERRNIAGTLPFMAPEQITHPETLDHRVDIYAFGVSLYQVMSGSLPFVSTRQDELIHQILNPHQQPRPLDGPFAELCHRCLKKNRKERFQSFDELRKAASAILEATGNARLPPPVESNDELELIYTKALSYGAMGHPDIALRHATEYARRVPDDDRAWTELSKQYLIQGKLKQSIKASRKALSIVPFKSFPRNNLGVALNRLGQHEEALRELKVAASHDPLNTGPLLNQLGPLMALRRPLEAVHVLERAALISPEKATIWANLGAVNLEIGEYAQAERCLKRALKLHPGLREAEENLKTLRSRRHQGSDSASDAGRLIAKGRFIEAEKILLQRVEQQPTDVDAWHNLGIVALQTKRLGRAKACFERVIQLKPDEDFSLVQLIRLKGGAGDFEGAIGHCEQLEKIPKKRVQAVVLRAQLLQGMGRYELAVKELREVVRNEPHLDEVWFILSELYEREGDLQASLESARHALALLRQRGGDADNIRMLRERIRRLSRT